VAQSPADWGAVPDKPEIDTPQNKATIERRNREATSQKAFLISVAQDTQPGLLARIGRGMLDLGQGVNQGVLNVEDAIGDLELSADGLQPARLNANAVTIRLIHRPGLYPHSESGARAVRSKSPAGRGKWVGLARMFEQSRRRPPSVLVEPQYRDLHGLLEAGRRVGWRRRSDRVLNRPTAHSTWQKCALRARDGRDGAPVQERSAIKQAICIARGGSGRGSRRGCTTLYGR